jgi:hypothetical protein
MREEIFQTKMESLAADLPKVTKASKGGVSQTCTNFLCLPKLEIKSLVCGNKRQSGKLVSQGKTTVRQDEE